MPNFGLKIQIASFWMGVPSGKWCECQIPNFVFSIGFDFCYKGYGLFGLSIVLGLFLGSLKNK